MNQRFANRHDEIVLIVGLALVRSLKQQDAIRQGIAVVPAALGQRGALVEPEQGIRRLNLHLAKQLAPRFVFDDDDEIRHGVAEAPRDAGERVGHEALELGAVH